MSSTAQRRRLGMALVAFAAVSWSLAGLFTRLIAVDTWTIQFWRATYGAVILLTYLTWQERGRLPVTLLRMTRIEIVYAVLAALAMLCFIAALRMTTVANVAVVYAISPFITGGLAWVLFGERMGARTGVAAMMALVGVALAVHDGGAGAMAGNLIAVAMTVLFALLVIISRFSDPGRSLVPAMVLGNILSIFVCLAFGSPFQVTIHDLLWLALFAVTNQLLGLVMFTAGSRLIPAAQSALISVIETPLAPMWVWIFLGEAMSGRVLTGGAIVVVAVIWNVIGETRRNRSSAAGDAP